MRLSFFILFSLVLAGCSTSTEQPPVDIPSTSTDSPTDTNVAVDRDRAPTEVRDFNAIADAEPMPVVRTRAGNKSPYTVFGKTYTLLPDSQGYREVGGASWYGVKFHGRRTANGEVYDMWGMTAAHKTLPIPSYVRVTNLSNGRSIVVKVNDRGPFHSDRIIDLSYGAAGKLGFEKQGVAEVEVVDITPVAGLPAAQTGDQASQAKDNAEFVILPADAPLTSAGEPAEKAPQSQQRETVTPVESQQAPYPVYFQVAAFKSAANARQLQATLSPLMNVPVNVSQDASNAWHRVRIGPINNTQSLAEVRQVLAEKGFKKPQQLSGQ